MSPFSVPYRQRQLLRWATVGGFGALLYFLIQLFLSPLRFAPLFLITLLVPTLLYAFCQLLCSWFVYLQAKPKPVPTVLPDLSVDVFVTACGEPYSMVQTSLKAAVEME